MKRPKRQSVRLSVCPIDRQQQRRAAGLLLSAPRTGSTAGDGTQQQMRAVSCWQPRNDDAQRLVMDENNQQTSSENVLQQGNRKYQISPRIVLLLMVQSEYSPRCKLRAAPVESLSIKPEVHNISQRRQITTEPRHYVTRQENLAKIGSTVQEIRSRTDTQTQTRRCKTHRQAHHNKDFLPENY